jgi:HK97 family phage prohead protease
MGKEERPFDFAQGGRKLPIRFAGYAAVFGTVDRGGDVVRRGAFARSLKRGGAVPLLWQHQAGAVIGRIEHLSEDVRGLRVIGTVADEKAARLVARGEIRGLSFGYRMREAAHGAGRRELIDLDLVEVSLVAAPMQPKARVHAIE